MGLREVGYPALILYPKRAFGIIDFDPLEYTIECELVMLTISAQNAKSYVVRSREEALLAAWIEPNSCTLLELVVDSG